MLRQPATSAARAAVPACQGVRLRGAAAAPFVAARPAAKQQPERRMRPGQCQAVYVAEQQHSVRTRKTTWDGPTARVTFKAKRTLPFGQVLKLVGGHPAMGDWDCAEAPVMKWTEGDVWQLELDLPSGEHEFKAAAVAVDGATGKEVAVEWEEGPNRVLQVPSSEAKAGGAFSVVMEWGNHTAAWLESQLPVEEHEHSTNGHSPNGGHSTNGNGNGDHNNGNGARQAKALGTAGQHLGWTMDDERAARRAVESERDQLRGERDSLAHQLHHAQDQLAAALAEKAQLEAAAARAQHNIDVLRNVGQMLRTMHTE